MRIWGVDGVSVDNEGLNSSLTGFDAVVDARIGSASGQIFPNVTDAISAGHRGILVRPGVYPGFTINDPGVSVQGIVKPRVSGNLIVSGAIFTSPITVSEKHSYLKFLGVNNSASHAFVIDDLSDHSAVEHCAAASPVGSGLQLSGAYTNLTISRCEFANCANGMLLAVAAAGDHMRGVRILNNDIHTAQGNGIAVMNYSTLDNSSNRSILVQGNHIYETAQGWGNGLTVENDAGAVLLANHVVGSGGGSNTDAHGIYVAVPSSAPETRTMLMGNVCTQNYGYGIALSSGSNRVGVVGNISVDNSGGNYANCQNSPGYAAGTTNVSS